MTTLTISGLPDAVYRALVLRAAQNARTLEEEICQILCDAVDQAGSQARDADPDSRDQPTVR